MDIAKLGVAIDPTRAVDGGKRVKEALTQIGQTAKTELGKLDVATSKNSSSLKATGAEAKKVATDIRQAGVQARGGFADMSRGLMDVLDAAGLMNNGFGALLRRTDSAIRGGEAVSRIMIQVKNSSGGAASGAVDLAAATAQASNGAVAMVAKFTPVIGIIGGVVLAFTAAVASGLILVGVFKAISASIPEAAKMESLRVRLAVAMGSFTEADKKFKDLKKFADETPFSDEEVFKAGVALQSMTDGALSGIPALTAIGGAASQAGDSFAVMAERVGQVYNGIQNGGDFIEQLKTLSNQGVVSGATLGAVKRLNDEASKGGDATAIKAKQWAMIYKDLEGKSIALILQSRTWNGLLSTIDGNWQSLKAAFGKPIMDALKPVLVDLIKLFPSMIEKATMVGEAFGNGFKIAYQLIKNGELGTAVGLALQAGISTAFSGINAYAATVWPTISAGIKQALWIGGTLAIVALIQMWFSMTTSAIQLPIKLLISLGAAAIKILVYALTFGTVNAFKTSTDGFTSNGGKAADYIGTALLNAVGQAFEDTVNAFLSAMKSAIVDIGGSLTVALANAIPGGNTLLNKYVKSIPKTSPPDPTTFVGPPSSAKPTGVDFFTPTPLPEISGLFDGGVLPPKTGSSSPESDLAVLSEKMLAQFEAQNPGFKNSDLGETFKPSKPVAEPSKPGGGGGPKKDAVQILKATPIESEMERLMTEWADLGKQIDMTMASAAQSVTSNMTGALGDIISGAKSAKQAFGEMATGIVQDITRMILQMTIQLAIQKALGGYGQAFQGIAASGSAGIAHTGGTVGQTNLSSIPRFHQGGGVSSEQNIRVDKGETVLTRRRSAELSRELAASRQTRQSAAPAAAGGNATIINVLDRNEIADAVARNPGAVVNAMSRNLPSVRRMVMTGNRA
jgi:Lambda phage tail tape-measure protein (Tape_meas_lam_C)